MPKEPQIILTGSDDSTIKLFDLRCDVGTPISEIKWFDWLICNIWSSHSAGVTTIQFFPGSSNEFVTGGFDENLFVFDYRQVTKPIISQKMPGAVWYIDFIKDGKDHSQQMLVAGSHDGCYLSTFNTSIDIIKQSSFQDALIYGVAHIDSKDNRLYLASNFYKKEIIFLS
ncbi:bifunctional WD40-YVTN repeat-like-containing domain superfamily/WD40-repeat-containing domain superfamily/WD40 repeat [Babesia duncani]|uniref:methylated diphthine methylhydrolase n=1 Tax=Babesia duncani TaxID=323732 RepID=A0AAD9PIL8_9APIC|nr:bifunctional WD40-YVTN repeat-like-containing domain superfamily/WD40-repeat-containing domain superfamily/WD40 repeat [Babesia duncani]